MIAADLERLRERFLQATTPRVFVDALRDLSASVQGKDLDVTDAARLAAEVIADASTIDGWTRGPSLVAMVDIVARLYLDIGEPEDAEGLSRAADLRRALERWATALPGAAPEAVAEQLNAAMLSTAAKGLSRSRLYMVRWAGLRTDDVEAMLLERGGTDDEIGRIALHTLALLAPEENVRKQLSGLLMDRARSLFEREVAGALAALGSHDVLEPILTVLGPLGPEEPELRRRAVSLAATLARKNPGNAAFQTRVLELFMNLVRADPSFVGEVAIRGDWLTCVNSRDLVSEALAIAGKADVPDHTRHLLLHRLGELESLEQVDGWRSARLGSPLIQRATTDTGTNSPWVGQEWQFKEAAWSALLAAGAEGALDQALEGVNTESNAYLYHHLASRLAAFAIPAVPESALEITRKAYDHPNKGNGKEYTRRIAVLRLVRSSPSAEAFRVLSRWRFTYEGQALTEVVRAFAEVAAHSVQDRGTEVRATLDAMSQIESPDWQRILAAAAGSALEHEGDYDSLLRRVSRALESGRDSTERALLIAGLGGLPPGRTLPHALKPALVDWCRSDNQLLARNAAMALAGTGLLRTEQELLKELVGLTRNGTYRWTNPRPTPRFAGLLISMMAEKEPEALRHAVVSIVDEGRWDVAASLVPAFTAIAAAGREAHAELIEAVGRRALRQSASRAETDWFGALASLSTDSFLAISWREVAQGWMPAALVNLAAVLRGIDPRSDLGRQQLRSHLEFLCRSPHFAVRRAGYRATAEAAPVFASTLFASWASASGADVRLHAAEALEWLPSSERAELYVRLKHDRVRRVRDAARRSENEAARRANLHAALDEVAGIDGTNAAIGSVWAHVEAVRRSGDDTVSERLRAILGSANWPSRVKRWLADVASDIDNRWKSANKDWPAPWHRWDGAVEELDATVSTRDKRIAVRVFLWKVATDYGPREWGGAIVESDQNAIPLFGMNEFRLELADGRVATALRQRYSTGTLSFVGQGDYPVAE